MPVKTNYREHIPVHLSMYILKTFFSIFRNLNSSNIEFNLKVRQ